MAALFVKFRSGDPLVTEATFVTNAPLREGAVTTSVSVAVAPCAIVPRSADSVPVPPTDGATVTEPCVTTALTNAARTWSVSVTPTAGAGPRLRTVTMNLMG
jgi:hypothetical protein